MSGTIYPLGIDGNSQLPLLSDGSSPIIADDSNRLRNAIIAVETELGINPSSIYGTISDRLNAISALLGIGSGSFPASSVSVVDADGYFTSTNVEAALAEIAKSILSLDFSASNISILDADGYFISTAVEGALAELATSILNLDFSASNISLLDSDGYFASADVEGALAETGSNLSALNLDFISGHIEAAANKAYYLGINLPYSGILNSFTTKANSGTADGYVAVNGVSLVEGPNAISITESTVNFTTLNTFAVGDDLSIVISNNSAALDVQFTLKYTRTS